VRKAPVVEERLDRPWGEPATSLSDWQAFVPLEQNTTGAFVDVEASTQNVALRFCGVLESFP